MAKSSSSKKKTALARPTPYRKLVFQVLLDQGGTKGTSMPSLTRLVEEKDPNKREIKKSALKRAVQQAVENGQVAYHKRFPRSLVLTSETRKNLRKGEASTSKVPAAKSRSRTTKASARKGAKSKVVKKKAAKRTVTTAKKTGAATKKRKAVPKKSGASQTKKKATSKTATKKKTTSKPKAKGSKAKPATGTSLVRQSTIRNESATRCDLISDKYDEDRFVVYQDPSGSYYDCMLVLQDLSKNMDKFYKMQVLHDTQENKYLVVVHFGRTGSAGQFQDHCKTDNPDVAIDKFETIFHSKVGLEWAFQPRDPVVPAQLPGKYQVIRKAYPSTAEREQARKDHGGEPIWQYFVDDGVDGKRTGWYDYDDGASNVVEGIYHEWVHNNQLGVRCVDSGQWQYSVSFNDMTQTNIKHPNHTQRKIRRGARN